MPNKLILALTALFFVTAGAAMADDGRQGHGGDKALWQQKHHYKHGKHGKHDQHYGKQGHGEHRYGRHGDGHDDSGYSHHAGPRVVWYGGRHAQPHYHWRPSAAVRKYGHGGHKSYWRRQDDDWALYAILALQIAEALNDNQRQHHLSAQRRAVSAPLGDSIRWNDGGAGGSVSVTREGDDGGGNYCREFQQEIFVGNRRQSGYGVACQQPDGAWEIVS